MLLVSRGGLSAPTCIVGAGDVTVIVRRNTVGEPMIVHSDSVFDGDTKGRAELFAATSTMAAPRQRITWWAENPR